jgi:hypothetical protein
VMPAQRRIPVTAGDYTMAAPAGENLRREPGAADRA